MSATAHLSRWCLRPILLVLARSNVLHDGTEQDLGRGRLPLLAEALELAHQPSVLVARVAHVQRQLRLAGPLLGRVAHRAARARARDILRQPPPPLRCAGGTGEVLRLPLEEVAVAEGGLHLVQPRADSVGTLRSWVGLLLRLRGVPSRAHRLVPDLVLKPLAGALFTGRLAAT